ncbi:hypothetical protein [Georgenia yuyongxinii]|uniref:Tetratricopeptide repeat protein n=1 Tax=Georgenia yuyongxinii TaxID=2589797 RepID=A0A552WVU7_9MICO|nr:hypothetical protein [Georgenia yuyongxinii]TRW46961.1 hypothetical protein FJ693_02975 [Georgenia yuyongxinii]
MTEHLRRRRRLLAWSAPAVLLALLAGAVLLGVALGNAHARSAYDAGAPREAATRYAHQQPFTAVVVEPWKAWFNSGTAHERGGEHFAALEDLQEAHRLVPAGTTDADGRPDPGTPECRVRNNLSLALESMGDAARAAADPAMAESYYREAMDTIGPCTSDGESAADQPPPEPDQQAEGPDRTEQRQRAKAEETEQQPQTGEPQPGQEPQDAPDAQGGAQDPPADPRQQELEERNRRAEQDRQAEEQRSGGGAGDGQNW